MKYVLGKRCKIVIEVDGKRLFYTVTKVLDISKNHISFIDKFGKSYTYSLDLLKEIHSVSIKA
jgi:hypothetical protein